MSTLSQFVGGAIKSIQRGTVALSGASSATSTISAVDTAKTELRLLGKSHTSTDVSAYIVLTNSTTVTATAATAATMTLSWELTEFY